jgi:CRISPR-associated protein Csx16
MNYLVSRHPGAVAWMRPRVPDQPVQVLSHLAADFRPAAGDRVYGVLPLAWVERIHRDGAQAWLLEIDLPAQWRGRELSAAQLDALQARLVRYAVHAVEVLG